MSSSYKLYHPKWHRRRIPIFWWLEKRSYTRFIIRELTSMAVGYFVVLTLVQLWVLAEGEAAYQRFLELLQRPPVLAFHALVLLALLFHTITWLNLAPKALVLRLAGKRLPDLAVLLAHYLAWLAVSALVLWGLVGR